MLDIQNGFSEAYHLVGYALTLLVPGVIAVLLFISSRQAHAAEEIAAQSRTQPAPNNLG